MWPTLRARKRERSFILTILYQNLEREEKTQSEEEFEFEFSEICKLSVEKKEFL